MTSNQKLLWVGDDYRIKTGYGRVANHLFSSLKKQFTISQYAIGCQGLSKTYHVIDSNDGTSFGFHKIAKVINVIKPDIVILLNDAKIIYGWLSALKEGLTQQCLIIPYVCTEYIGVPTQDIELYNQTTHAMMAMANFTIQEFVSQGYQHQCFRLSHGYPKTIAKRDKAECKRQLQIDPDTFVFFSGSKNQPRKRLDIIIRAFVHFLKTHPQEKVLLMMNCGLIDSGWNIKQLYERLCRENGISDKEKEKHIYYCSDQLGDSNKNDEQLSIIYNASDVGITTSTGESFGLIPFEQSKLGIPQIIPDWGGIIEAVPHGSLKIAPHDYYVYPVTLQAGNGEARTVYYQDVADAMHKYYTDKDLYQTHCREVTKNVEGYSWEQVADQFLEIINQVSIPTKPRTTSNNIEIKINKDKDKIPKIIHQIWIGDKPPPYQYLNTWKKAHPDWTYHLWDNDRVAKETFTNQVLIDNYPAIVSKVDLIRYELLYKYGGIYIDADIICLKPLDDHFLQHNFFSVYYKNPESKTDPNIRSGKVYIGNSTFGCPPNSEILGTLIKNFHQTIPLKLHHKISDPVTLTGVPFHELLASTKLSHYIYPNHYFNQQDFLEQEQTADINRDEMYGLHLWGTTRSNMTNGGVDLYREHLVNIPFDDFDFNICVYPDQEQDLISETLKHLRIWEPEITQKLVDILKQSPKDQLFVDVGANLGYYSLLAASLGFTCYSFEPFSKNYSKFTSSIMLNSLYSKIFLAKKIVWNEDGVEKSMEIVPGPITNYGCIKVANDQTSSETCQTCILDTAIPTGKKITVLKIDVEGSEPEVIMGCQQLISQNLVENIFMEISPKFRSKQQYLEIVRFLIGHSYRIYDFEGQQYCFGEMVFDIPETQKDYLFVKDHFLPIFSINLKSQHQRRNHLIQQLKQHQLTYDNILIDAIDGTQIRLDQQPYISQHAVSTILNPEKEHGHDMTKGGLGLIATMINIWTLIRKPCLILEDDMQLEDNFLTQLAKYLAQLPDTWDLFYLGYYHDPRLSQVSENIYTANKVYGLFGYLINPSAIPKILQSILPCDYQLDTEIHRRCKDLKTYVAYPPLIQHSGKFPTSIQIYDTMTSKAN